MKDNHWADFDPCIWHPFTALQGDFPILPIARAKGAYLYTPDGRSILDAISSWWVNLHGHGHPYIAESLQRQVKTLDHIMFAGLTHAPAATFAKRILGKLPTGFGRVFFSDNGSTAVEVAIKAALQYWHNRGIDKKRVIAIRGAYHGDTFGGMSVADRTIFNQPFRDKLFAVDFIDFPAKEGLQAALEQQKQHVARGDVAAFIFEPLIQGVAGMRMYEAEALDALISIAREASVLCIADEVLTGFGRTGKWFASDHLTEKPDIIALSKGITGGVLPLGLTAFHEAVVQPFDSPHAEKTLFHGHSYTANALACAAANASLTLMEKKNTWQCIHAIAKAHDTFSSKMNQQYGDQVLIEAKGVVLACRFLHKETDYQSAWRMGVHRFFLQRNVLIRPLGSVVYILPPYIIPQKALHDLYGDIEEFVRTGGIA